jgi:hypothetical protein
MQLLSLIAAGVDASQCAMFGGRTSEISPSVEQHDRKHDRGWPQIGAGSRRTQEGVVVARAGGRPALAETQREVEENKYG